MELARYLKTLVITSPLVKVKGSSSSGKQDVDKALPKFTISFTQKFFFTKSQRKDCLFQQVQSQQRKPYTRVLFLVLNFAIFSVRLCRSKRLNFKNLLKILVSIDFKFDKAKSQENILLILQCFDIDISVFTIQDERLIYVTLPSHFYSLTNHRNDKVVVTVKYLPESTKTYIFINGLGRPLL